MFSVCGSVCEQTPLSRFMSLCAHPNEKVIRQRSIWSVLENSWHVLEIFPKLKAICCWPLRAMVLFFLLHFLFFSVAINSQQKLQKSGNDPGTFSSRLASSYAGHQHRFYSTFYKLPSSRSLSLSGHLVVVISFDRTTQQENMLQRFLFLAFSSSTPVISVSEGGTGPFFYFSLFTYVCARVCVDDCMSWLTIFGKQESRTSINASKQHPFNTHPAGLWASNEVESA